MGGMDDMSENRWSLARHLTFLDTELDAMAAARSNGEEVDMEVAATMVGQLSRGLKVLGLDRVKPMREINPIMDHFSRPPEPKG